MRAKTVEGTRLKRLIGKYVKAAIDQSWMGYKDAEEHNDIEENYKVARKKLWDEIDRLTSIDLTPRAEQDRLDYGPGLDYD